MEEKTNKLTEIVVGSDDLKNTLDFFKLFKVEITPELEATIDRLSKDPKSMTLKDQEEFRVKLCDAMLKSKHPMFADELFVTPLENAARIVYESSFTEDLVETIGVEESEG